MEDHKKKADQLKGQITTFRKTEGEYKRTIQQLTEKIQEFHKKEEEDKLLRKNKRPEVEKVPRLQSKQTKLTQPNNIKTLAENIVETWKKKEETVPNITKQGLEFIKATQKKHLMQIKLLEEQLQKSNTKKDELIAKNIRYEKGMSIKGSEFAYHLQRTLEGNKTHEGGNEPIDNEVTERIKDVLQLLKKLVHTKKTLTERQTQQYKEEEEELEKNINTSMKVMMKQKLILQSGIQPIVANQSKVNKSLRKPPPIVRKNVFGYYQQPQFQEYAPVVLYTKHCNNTKSTQTLSDDLSILLVRPVVQLLVNDGNIKPQRNRHRKDYYVRIYCNAEKETFIETTIKSGFEPVWEQTLLMREYDFPFLHLQLMNQSKGIRDISIGRGKVAVTSVQQKDVKIMDEKGQFQGRVRLGIRYPKTTIFQYTILSARLLKPQDCKILRQTVLIICPLNPRSKLVVSHPQFITYCQIDLLIAQGYAAGSMVVSIIEGDKKGKVGLEQLSKKEGDMQLQIDIGNGWKVILQGHIVVLISQEEQPEQIQSIDENHRYFSVRASFPVNSAIYSGKRLPSSVKFPLVFKFQDGETSLTIIKERSKDSQERPQSIYQPLLNPEGQMIEREFIKVPKKVCQLYYQSLQGEAVKLVHQTALFQRMPKEIQFKVGGKEFFVQSQDLMEGYYKVFRRTFKKIGHLKFKVGFRIYENELRMHKNKDQKNSSARINEQTIQQTNIKDRYITLEVTCAYLPDSSTYSSYSCTLSGQSTSQMKGNTPHWQEQFIVQYTQSISYQLLQHNLLTSKVISSGVIILENDFRLLRLGVVCIKVCERGVLYIGKVILPDTIRNIAINSAFAEIEEEADWIGNIDPYFRLYAMNRELYRSSVVDGGGRKSQWSQVNFRTILTTQQLLGYFYDQDIVGKDDFLGEFRVEIKQSTHQIKTKLIKQGKIGGNILLNGHFQEIKINPIQIPKMIDTLTIPDSIKTKKTLYRAKIYGIKTRSKELQGNEGWIQIPGKPNSKSFVFNNKQIQDIDCTYFGFQDEEVTWAIFHKPKSFFKSQTKKLGDSKILLTSVMKLKKLEVPITTLSNQIGKCILLVEPVDTMKIGIIGDCTNALEGLYLTGDLGDSARINEDTTGFGPTCSKPLTIVFAKEMSVKITTIKEKEENLIRIVEVQGIQQFRKNVKVYQVIFNQQIYARFSMAMYDYERKRFPSSQNVQSPQRCAKQLSLLKWQPLKAGSTSESIVQFQMRFSMISSGGSNRVAMEWVARNELSQFNTSQQGYRMELFKISKQRFLDKKPFICNNLPSFIRILQSGKQIQRIKGQGSAGSFLHDKGAFFYKWKDFKETYTQVNFAWLYIRFTCLEMAYQSCKIILGVRAGELTEVVGHQQKKNHSNDGQLLYEVFYQNLEQIGFDGFYGQGMTFLLPGSRVTNLKLYFTVINTREKQILLQETVQIECREGTSYPVAQDSLYRYSFQGLMQVYHHQKVKQYKERRKLQTPYTLNMNSIQVLTSTEHSGSPKIRITLSGQQIIVPTEGKQSAFYYQPSESIQFILCNDNRNQKQQEITGQIWSEGVLTNKSIGKFIIKIKKQTLKFDGKYTLRGEVKQGEQTRGKVSIQFTNQKYMAFCMLDLEAVVLKQQLIQGLDVLVQRKGLPSIAIEYERQKKVSRKSQYQEVDIFQWQSKRNLILLKQTEQQQNRFTFQISNSKDKNMLGAFSLLIPVQGQVIVDEDPVYPFSQALRMGSLNGIVMGSLTMLSATRELINNQQINHPGCIQLTLSSFNFKQSSHDFEMIFQSDSRKLRTKKNQYNRLSDRTEYVFNIEWECEVKISLVTKEEPIATARIGPNLKNQEELIAKFQNQISKSLIAACKVRIIMISQPCVELISLQARDLINTEYFVDMTPYLQISTLNNEFVTETSKGRSGLFWKIGLIEPLQQTQKYNSQIKPQPLQGKSVISVVIKDKDLLFDDYIGKANLSGLQTYTNKNELQFQIKGQKGERNGVLIATKKLLKGFSIQELEKQKEQYKTQYQVLIMILDGVHNQQIKTIEVQLSGLTVWKVNSYDPTLLKDLQVIIPVKFHQHQLPEQNKQQQIILKIISKNSKNQQINTKNPIQVTLGSIKNEKFIDENITCRVKQLYSQQICVQQVFIWSKNMQSQTKKTIAIISNNQILSFCQQQLKVRHSSRPSIFSQGYALTLQMNSYLAIIGKGLLKIVVYKGSQGDKWAECLFQIKNFSQCNRRVLEGDLKKGTETIGRVFMRLQSLMLTGDTKPVMDKIKKSDKFWYELTIKQAKLNKDIQLFGKMDPYCIIQYGKERFQTTVQEDIGKNPIWNQTFMFSMTAQLTEGEKIHFKLMDSEIMKDRDIGQCQLQLPPISSIKQSVEYEITVLANNQEGGKLYCSLSETRRYLVILRMEYACKPYDRYILINNQWQARIEEGLIIPISGGPVQGNQDDIKQGGNKNTIIFKNQITKEIKITNFKEMARESQHIVKLNNLNLWYLIFD